MDCCINFHKRRVAAKQEKKVKGVNRDPIPVDTFVEELKRRKKINYLDLEFKVRLHFNLRKGL